MALPAVFAGLLRAAGAALLRSVGLGAATRPAISKAAKGLKQKAKEGFGRLAAASKPQGQPTRFKGGAIEAVTQIAQRAGGRVLEGYVGPENARAITDQLAKIARPRAGGAPAAAPRPAAPAGPAPGPAGPRWPWWLGGPRQPAAPAPAHPGPRPAQPGQAPPHVPPGQAPVKGPAQEAADKLRQSGQPTPPAAPGATAPTPLAQVRVADRPMGGHVPTARAAPPAPPHVGPRGSTGTLQPPPPVGPSGQAREPRGPFEDAAARFQYWRQNRAQTASDYQESKRPVSDDTKGLDLQERYDRLAKSNILPKIETVAKALGTPSPTQEQQVQFGEKAEQERRDERRQQIEQAGGPPSTITKGGLASLAILLGVKLPAAVGVAVFGLEKLGGRIMDSNEHLRRWSSTINTAFARLEHQALVLDARTAQATRGSAGALGEGLRTLRNDLQPLRETVTTVKNLIGLGLVYLADIAARLLVILPNVQTAMMALKMIEAHLAAEQRSDMRPFVDDFLARIAKGELGTGPSDRRPRAGPQVPAGPQPPPRGAP